MASREMTMVLTLWGAVLLPTVLIAQMPLPDGRRSILRCDSRLRRSNRTPTAGQHVSA